MKFSERYITRWHDTDAFRRVRPTRMLVYMQETSNLHMMSRGMSLDDLRDKKKLAFILSKIRMKIYAPLYLGEEIEVQTWTYETRGLGTGRFYRILREGEIIAYADTTWALVDLESGGLVGMDRSGYGFEHEDVVTLDVPPRFRVPKGTEFKKIAERDILYSDLDYNMHMNNTKYADMLLDYIPLEETGRVGGFFLSYLHEAAFGDRMDVMRLKDGDRYYFRTVNREGTVCLEAMVILNGSER